MELNLPIITKKICNMLKLAIFMLKKGFSKKKILLDPNLMMKRGKMAFTGKVSISRGHVGFGLDTSQAYEYEFSCSNTTLYRQYFTKNKKNHQNNNYYMPSPKFEDIIDNFEAVNMLETMFSSKDSSVRQLRITDSPFPLKNEEDYGDQRVDEAAEEFIKRFYLQLKEQNC